jgi:hypothetical protein
VPQAASTPQAQPSAPRPTSARTDSELHRITAETVAVTIADGCNPGRGQVRREGERRRQSEHRQNLSLEVLNANREKNAMTKRIKRAAVRASLLAAADSHLAHHRAGDHVEHRNVKRCWSCWKLAVYECFRLHDQLGGGCSGPRQCRVASCIVRVEGFRPYLPTGSSKISVYGNWGPDLELDRIKAAPSLVASNL